VTSYPPIVELVPHRPPMLLLDRVLSYDGERVVCETVLGPDSPFAEQGEVPAVVGIEYMAQTIAAHAGLEARARGEPPAIGFLLGTRAYSTSVDTFPNGSKLTVTVEPEIVDGGFAAFKCAIAIDDVAIDDVAALDRIVATAVVTTYRPSTEEIATLQPATRNV
jgi:predicted hotdog family 3-hydroxylacyl-ACP dehydratase